MEKKKDKTTKVTKEQNRKIAYNVVELDKFRDKLARLLLALIGLRNILFISSKNPIVVQEVEKKPKAKARKKSSSKKAV